MKKYCVIGHPIEHSLSPQMHNLAFQNLSIDANYSKLDILPEEIEEKIIFLKENFAGWNITIPYKEVLFNLVDEIDFIAQQSHSINTIINDNGRLLAHSTDGYGLASSIEKNFSYSIKSGSFCFIGAGGAARASAIYFAAQGAKAISIVNRTIEKAQFLAEQIYSFYPQCQIKYASLKDISKLEDIFNQSEIIIQSTDIGLKDREQSPIDLSLLKNNHCVVDMIYHQTKLQKYAQKHTKKVINGIDMLLYQGVKSFELWTGKTPPIEKMRKTLLDNINL